MKVFWLVYDLILMLMTVVVVFVYLIVLLDAGGLMFLKSDFVFIPSVNNLYIGMCAIRLVSKYINSKLN